MSLSDELRDFLGEGDEIRVAILGIGSTIRGDDAVGMEVVKHLKEREMDNVLLLETHTVPENFTGYLREFSPTHIIMVDAAHLQEEPGAMKIIPAQMIGDVCISTHKLPLTVLITFIEKSFNAQSILVGIQPLSITFGTEMTPEVEKAAKEVAEQIYEVLRRR
jgi:hydrogenase 3 maturation protease